MAQRQPEGRIKDDCREVATAEDLLFWQIEGKSRNGVPDTVAGRVAGGVIFIEFKVPGRYPNDQQWLRIYELREAGQEAWWCNSVEMYRQLVGLDPGGYEVVYPKRILELIELGTTADDAGRPPKGRQDDSYERFFHLITTGRVKRPTRGTGA